MTALEAGAVPALLEAIMLLCFGLAWPAANLRLWRRRSAEGRGCGFTACIFCGYLAGAAAKLVLARGGQPLTPVFWLYALNTVSVAVHLGLQWRFRRGLERARAGP